MSEALTKPLIIAAIVEGLDTRARDVHAQRGANGEALALLETAFKTLDPGMLWAPNDPLLDPLRGEARTVVPWSAEGDHGGGDRLMLEDIFLPSPAADKYLRAADERVRAGIHSNAAIRISQSATRIHRPMCRS